MSNTKQKKNKGRVRYDLQSDNESINDIASNCSYGSNETENHGTPDDNQVASPSEKYEEKILQSIDNATEKSAKTRIEALRAISEILQHRYSPDFIEERKFTILDIIEKSLRRGKHLEQETAAKLATLMILQIGVDDEELKTIFELLSSLLQNPTSSCSVKIKSCSAISMFSFLNNDDIGNIVSAMQKFEQIFTRNCANGEKSTTLETQLRAEALSGWGLMASLIPPGDFCSYINNHIIMPSMGILMELLNSPHVEVRMAVGEIIAIIYERGRIHEENFLNSHLLELIELTSVLSKDSQKHRAKKERKAQRASFRDVLRYLEEDVSPEIIIRFGEETLTLNSWSKHIQYEKLCEVIGPGITTHLSDNEFIRDIFQLGPKIVHVSNVSSHKQSKMERNWMNAAAFKARTISLKKNRDKRSTFFN